MTQWQIPEETKELIFQIFADFGNPFDIHEDYYVEESKTSDWLEKVYFFSRKNKNKHTLWVTGRNSVSIYYPEKDYSITVASSTIQEQDTTDDIMQICEFMQMRYLKYLERKEEQ
jgi:hypothetical protein